MGVLSWFSSTARKSAAAAALEAYYLICKRHGVFSGDPAKFANRIVATACDRLPDIAQGGMRQYVLAAACLTVVMVDEKPETDNARLYAMGLGAMLKAVMSDSGFHPSVAEERILNASSVVLEKWNDRESPLLTGMRFSSSSAAPCTPRHSSVPETYKARESQMEELIRRVNQ